MLELIQQYNFTQIIQESTHFTEHSESLIDLILVSNLNNIVTSDTSDHFIDNQVRDHCPIICVLKFLRPIPKTYKKRIWLYDKADFNYFRNILATTDWNFISKEQNLDLIVENFNNVLLQAAEKPIPNKIATIRPTEYPWINGLIRKLKRKRKRLYQKVKRTNSEKVWQKFKRTRNIVTNELRKSKQEYLDKLTDQLNVEKVNPKTFWKISKQLFKLDISSSSIPPLNINGQILESDQEEATALNEYFSSRATVNDTNKSLPLIVPLTYPALTSITMSEQGVHDVLKSLNASKSCGPDLINPRLLKEGADIIKTPLTKLSNLSLDKGDFTHTWKMANVTPVHKKNEKTLPGNYRPVSLLSTIGKSMERCVHKHLYNFVLDHRLIPLFSQVLLKTTPQQINSFISITRSVNYLGNTRIC